MMPAMHTNRSPGAGVVMQARRLGEQSRWGSIRFGGSLALLFAASCSQFVDPNVPEIIRPLAEPEGGGEYLLYRPSGYDRTQSWPLVVVCPSSFPDSANRQIREWTELAEQYGFLVVAPRLKFSRKSWSKNPTEGADVLRANDIRVLSTVRHVRAGQNVSEDRVLIYGWKRGAAAALYTGLRNPETFRAVSVTRPRLYGDALPGPWNGIDRHQAVRVHYDVDDFVMGRHGHNVVEWLRAIGVNLEISTLGSARRGDTADAVQFFQEVIRKQPWVHVRAFAPDTRRPLEVHFKLKASRTPTRYRWYFGDGDESTVAQPIHVYAQPGTYRVTVTVPGARGNITRSVNVTVPGPQLHAVND